MVLLAAAPGSGDPQLAAPAAVDPPVAHEARRLPGWYVWVVGLVSCGLDWSPCANALLSVLGLGLVESPAIDPQLPAVVPGLGLVESPAVDPQLHLPAVLPGFRPDGDAPVNSNSGTPDRP
ncbi:hypothetical protein BRADI_1g31605v3 [Brachypodium distachyon]|uniref:Uncharacterized protein n=1 Tax=Brachypodium distachyon TaxID=15368 RepID=A0A0Q3RVJ8_BRADI|nr:hypothetical protein BRADI_1g31605v3 [Brachypodium distachyon]